MKRETLFLKIVVFFIGISIAALFVTFLPVKAARVIMEDPTSWFRVLLTLLFLYANATPFLFALYQALKMLNYIEKNNAFSDLSVQAIKKIKWCAFSIAILFTAILPYLFYWAEIDDAPGLAAIGLIVMGGSFVVALFAAVFQKLLVNAIEIKTENELTV